MTWQEIAQTYQHNPALAKDASRWQQLEQLMTLPERPPPVLLDIHKLLAPRPTNHPPSQINLALAATHRFGPGGNTSYLNASSGLRNESGQALGRDEQLAQVEVAVLATILALAVVGNVCVLVALARRRKITSRMHMFILHLSVADLLVAFCNILPQLAWDLTGLFLGGDFLCRTVKFLQVFVMYLSTYVLVMTAIDRYRAICYPLSNYSWTPQTVNLMILGVYILSAVLSVPQILLFKYQVVNEQGDYDCWANFEPDWLLKAYIWTFTALVYFLPFVLLAYSYGSICYTIWAHQPAPTQRTRPGEEERRGTTTTTTNLLTTAATTPTSTPRRTLWATSTATLATNGKGAMGVGGGAVVLPNGDLGMNHHYHLQHQHHHHHHPLPCCHPSNYHHGAYLPPATASTPSTTPRRWRTGSHSRHLSHTNGSLAGGGGEGGLGSRGAGGDQAARPRVHSMRGFSRAKLKTVKLTLVVIAAYLLCWSPFFVSQIWWLYDPEQETNSAVVIMVLLSSLNSCCNPWIYLAFSGNLLRHLLPCCNSPPCPCCPRGQRCATPPFLLPRSPSHRPHRDVELLVFRCRGRGYKQDSGGSGSGSGSGSGGVGGGGCGGGGGHAAAELRGRGAGSGGGYYGSDAEPEGGSPARESPGHRHSQTSLLTVCMARRAAAAKTGTAKHASIRDAQRNVHVATPGSSLPPRTDLLRQMISRSASSSSDSPGSVCSPRAQHLELDKGGASAASGRIRLPGKKTSTSRDPPRDPRDSDSGYTSTSGAISGGDGTSTHEGTTWSLFTCRRTGDLTRNARQARGDAVVDPTVQDVIRTSECSSRERDRKETKSELQIIFSSDTAARGSQMSGGSEEATVRETRREAGGRKSRQGGPGPAACSSRGGRHTCRQAADRKRMGDGEHPTPPRSPHLFKRARLHGRSSEEVRAAQLKWEHNINAGPRRSCRSS